VSRKPNAPAADAARTDSRTASPTLDLQVRAEQARILYRQAPAGFVVNILLAALLIFMVSDGPPKPSAIVWYAALAAAAAMRLVLWFGYRRLHPTTVAAARWERWFFFAMLGTSFVWGSGSVVLITPYNVTLQLGVTATVVCLAAGIAATTLANIKAIYVILAAGIPYVTVFALQGTLVHELIALLILVSVIGTSVLARNSARMLTELIALRLEVATQRDVAERANLAKSKFLAAASHDLRQPLHAMTLLADALEGRLQDAADRRTLASLQDSLAAMRNLFNALLDISRLDAGVVEPHIKDMRLSRLIDRLQTDYAPQAQQKNLEWRCPPATLVVRSDPVLLENLLRNLIGNAIRYTQRGYVAVCCRESDGFARIEVEDSGIGIAPDKQQEIFREFMQLNNPERDGAKGLGLGLAIVDGLAQLLEHRIEVRSAPGEGSCFTVVLPLGSAATLQESDSTNEETVPGIDLAGMVVLVIDDQTAARDSMKTLLERWGCEVIVADSEETALAAVRKSPRPPELIVADYRLREDCTGRQAIDRVRHEFDRAISALIVTGDTAPEHLREVRASGDMLMHKPVPPGRLRAYLRTVRRTQSAA
jgi:signal transduction histidine kinase/CheY-like chemotaxis protein